MLCFVYLKRLPMLIYLSVAAIETCYGLDYMGFSSYWKKYCWDGAQSSAGDAKEFSGMVHLYVVVRLIGLKKSCTWLFSCDLYDRFLSSATSFIGHTSWQLSKKFSLYWLTPFTSLDLSCTCWSCNIYSAWYTSPQLCLVMWGEALFLFAFLLFSQMCSFWGEVVCDVWLCNIQVLWWH